MVAEGCGSGRGVRMVVEGCGGLWRAVQCCGECWNSRTYQIAQLRLLTCKLLKNRPPGEVQW